MRRLADRRKYERKRIYENHRREAELDENPRGRAGAEAQERHRDARHGRQHEAPQRQGEARQADERAGMAEKRRVLRLGVAVDDDVGDDDAEEQSEPDEMQPAQHQRQRAAQSWRYRLHTYHLLKNGRVIPSGRRAPGSKGRAARRLPSLRVRRSRGR